MSINLKDVLKINSWQDKQVYHNEMSTAFLLATIAGIYY